MFLFKNAIKNVSRNKSRYILISAIMVVMLIAITISTMINSTTRSVIDDYIGRFNTRVFFTQDIRRVLAQGPDEHGFFSAPRLTTEQFLLFADSKYVVSTLFTGSIHVYGDSLHGFDQDGQLPDLGDGFAPTPEQEAIIDARPLPNSVVLGFSDLSMIEDFSMGLRTISEGRFFANLNECIISYDFAQLNNLRIGDTISVFNVDDPEHTLTLTVVGIYYDLTTAQTGAAMAVNNRRNEILVSYETLIEGSTFLAAVYTSATFFIRSPEYGAAFERELRDKGLSDVFIVNIDATNYQQIVQPVRGLARISNMMLLVVLAFGCSVLILLSVLSVRERKYEIGVLRAMGMEKGRVAAGLMLETLVIIAVCLVIGLGVGIAVAQPVSNNILEEQLRIAQEAYTPFEAGFGDIHAPPAQVTRNVDYSSLVDVNVTVTSDMLMLTIAIAMLLGLLSNSIGLLYITRFEPIRILAERD